MKNKIIILIVISILLMGSSMSFAEISNPMDILENTIQRVIGNGLDNIKAVTQMIGDLIDYTTSKFSDVNVNDWFVENVSKLVGLKGLEGYEDNTFKPNKEMTKAEFIKTTVAILGFDEGQASNGHWASNYIKKARELNLIDNNEYLSGSLDSSISRNEMAKISSRALDYLGESHISKRADYSYQIKDYNNIPKEYQDYVLKVYTKGIIKGYPGGEFIVNKGLTRAEASTVIVRILDKDKRELPSEPKKDIPTYDRKTTEVNNEDIKRLQAYPLNTMYYIDKEDVIKDYKDFDEYYRTKKSDCELAVKLISPSTYTPKELKGVSFKWFTSPKLVYKTVGGTYGIRGIVQKQENNKIYESDFELMITNVSTGTRLESDYSGRLSEWKEVK